MHLFIVYALIDVPLTTLSVTKTIVRGVVWNARRIARSQFGCGIRHQEQSKEALTSNERCSQQSGEFVAAEGGIFENLLLEQVGLNNGNFIKSDLALKLIR